MEETNLLFIGAILSIALGGLSLRLVRRNEKLAWNEAIAAHILCLMFITKGIQNAATGYYNEAIALEDLNDVLAAADAGRLSGLGRVIHPLSSVLDHLPSAIIRDSAAERVAHGSPLMRPGVVAIEDSSLEAETVLLRTQDGSPIALAEWRIPPATWVEISNGEVFQPRTVLVRPRPLTR